MQLLRALAFLTLALLAAPIVHGQKAGVKDDSKCPIKDRKRYDSVLEDDPPIGFADPLDKAWFTAPTTSALHQAAYVFDTARVKCLLTVAKIDPNLKVPYKGPIQPVPMQWPLGAAIFRLDELYSTKKVTDDMIGTITALLKGGANPNTRLYEANITALARIAFLTCTDEPPGNCQTVPGVLTVAKALVSAGAEIDPVGRQGDTPLGRLVFGIAANHCEDEDPVYKQFMEFLISQEADVEYALNAATPFGPQSCPQLFAWLRKAAAAQQTRRTEAAAKNG